MCDDGIDYFAYAECLNDLVQTEHLRLTEEGCYAITPKGLKNSEICESSLPYSGRLLLYARPVWARASSGARASALIR